MSSTTFGEVTYEGAPEQTPGATNGATEQVVIDPNDPALTSESLDMNLDANAYDVPPPPPDGTWLARLKQVDIEDAQKKKVKHRTAMATWLNPPKPFFCINLETSLIDQTGKNDGVQMTEYWVKTLVANRSKVSPLASIGVALGQRDKLAQARTQADVLVVVEGALASEPQVVVQTQWEATCRSCEESAKKKGGKKPGVFLYEERNFPADGHGGHNPQVKCPACGGTVRAQARVKNYLPVGTKVTQGISK